MTYQGERARQAATEVGRYFEVSKVRLDPDGHVTDVLWIEVDAGSNRAVGTPVVAAVAEVVDAIHDGAQVAATFDSTDPYPRRPLVVIQHNDGRECIAIGGTTAPGRNISDLDRLEPLYGFKPRRHFDRLANERHDHSKVQTFAVSKVHLDAAGRIADVLWGRVDIGNNTWATPEVIAPVASAVDALRAGHQVFALFPSIHGHLPERRFVVADYDGDRNTIVLYGPSTKEREVHDMDRLDMAELHVSHKT